MTRNECARWLVSELELATFSLACKRDWFQSSCTEQLAPIEGSVAEWASNCLLAQVLTINFGSAMVNEIMKDIPGAREGAIVGCGNVNSRIRGDLNSSEENCRVKARKHEDSTGSNLIVPKLVPGNPKLK
jgi:hypothetical protein